MVNSYYFYLIQIKSDSEYMWMVDVVAKNAITAFAYLFCRPFIRMKGVLSSIIIMNYFIFKTYWKKYQ